jgi:hypothetical protein
MKIKLLNKNDRFARMAWCLLSCGRVELPCVVKVGMIFDFILRNSRITDDAASVDFSAIWMVSRQFHQHCGGEECATVGGALPLSVLPCGPIDAGACAVAMQATHLCRLEPVRTCFGA